MELENELPQDAEIEKQSPAETVQESEQEATQDQAPASESPTSSTRDTRETDRLRAVETQARIYQEELDRTRRELDALRSSQREDPRAEQARLEAMDPEQRILYHFDKARQEDQARLVATQAQTVAQIDRMKFEASVAQNPAWKKFDAEIEQMYNRIAGQAISAGQPVMITRNDLLKHRLGEEVMNSLGKTTAAAAARGKTNIQRQNSPMIRASSNATGAATAKSAAEASRERMLKAGVLEM